MHLTTMMGANVHGTMQVAVALSKEWKPASVEGLPNVFTGGWVGYCGYDTVRYVYSSKDPPHQNRAVYALPQPFSALSGPGLILEVCSGQGLGCLMWGQCTLMS